MIKFCIINLRIVGQYTFNRNLSKYMDIDTENSVFKNTFEIIYFEKGCLSGSIKNFSLFTQREYIIYDTYIPTTSRII
jgi:hypothetical protein